jgi:hypothetical protein
MCCNIHRAVAPDCDQQGRGTSESRARNGIREQRSALGFNLNKLMNGLAERRRLVLVG